MSPIFQKKYTSNQIFGCYTPNFSLKKNIGTNIASFVRTTWLLIILGVGTSLLSFYFYSLANENQKTLIAVQLSAFEKHERLQRFLGYGGFIHDFKNLVIRKDTDRYEAAIRTSLNNANELLLELEDSGAYSTENVQALQLTLDEYEEKFELSLQLIEQGAASEDIDALVAVDDTQALAAIESFSGEVRTRLENQSEAIAQSFTAAYLVHLVTGIAFICLVVFSYQSMSRARIKEQKLTEEAIKANKSKSEFLANMSHEIRTPLHGVSGSLQILKRNLKNKENIEWVDKSIISTKSLLSIINDILDISRVESRQLRLEEVPFSIHQVVDAAYSNVATLAEDKGLKISMHIDESLAKYWKGDPVRIKQILLNLLGNSVKFTEQGEVSIHVSKATKQDRGLMFEVKDTGIGMSADTISNLFKRFEQGDSSITREYGGSGLGMAITKELITMMNGEINVESEEGIGSTFTVYLPLEESSMISPEKQAQEKDLVHDFSSLDILVAEDNAVNQAVIEAMLEQANVEPRFAADGQEAIVAYTKQKPDLIFMDIQMPIMDGIAACAEIRKLDKEIIIVALTANVMTDDIEHYFEVGFSHFMPKPVDMDELFEYLGKVQKERS